jgi:hypothetical protein
MQRLGERRIVSRQNCSSLTDLVAASLSLITLESRVEPSAKQAGGRVHIGVAGSTCFVVVAAALELLEVVETDVR